jgi:uncharacterized protein (TIGR02246 family)
MKKTIILFAAVVVCLVAVDCRSADKKVDEAAKKAADEFFDSYKKTFDAGEAKALASLWKTDGEIVDAAGTRIHGRDAVEKLFADFFAKNSGGKIAIELVSAKFDKENVLVAEILPKIDPPVDKTICQVGAVVVLVKDTDGKWLIEGIRERNPIPACHEQLKPLEWLVGDWKVSAKTAENLSFSMHCHWTENKSYLICMYTARYQDTLRHGTEVIGWDAKEKKIRSWVFDSSGGFNGGSWKQDGKRWVVDITGTTADGKTAKNTTILTQTDADGFLFESKNRTIDGEKADDIPQLQLQRVKSQLPEEPNP